MVTEPVCFDKYKFKYHSFIHVVLSFNERHCCTTVTLKIVQFSKVETKQNKTTRKKTTTNKQTTKQTNKRTAG